MGENHGSEAGRDGSAKAEFSERLRRRLEREAKKHGTSLNTEIVNILEGAFQQSDNTIRTRAEIIAEALGDELVNAIVERAAKKDAATEQEIIDYAMNDAERGKS